MTVAIDAANAEQATYWNGEAGRRWVEQQESQDRLFTEITAALFEAAAPKVGERVIDVGCGAGETTLRAAALTGDALGVDVSGPLVARARERGAGSPARFALADATAYDFSAEAADLTISRFGVMFFAEPSKSFANLRRGMKPGARLVLLCWRAPALNPWLMLPYVAIKPHLPPQPAQPPNAPGPFGFADELYVRGVLEAAGFAEVSFEPRAFHLDVAGGEGLDAAVAKALALGPTNRALQGQPDEVVATARAAIRDALGRHLNAAEVRLDAALWIVRATA
jgi:SAM-dependent methyltransferase